jgi:hypothetical protein
VATNGSRSARATPWLAIFSSSSLMVAMCLLTIGSSTRAQRVSAGLADLGGANIKGQIDMSGANFDRTLDAHSLQVGEVLLMGSEGENKTSFKDADLGSAKIRGPINKAGPLRCRRSSRCVPRLLSAQ